MILKYYLLGGKVVVDSIENNVSVTNIIEEFHSSDLPGIVAEFNALACIEREGNDPDEFSGSLEIKIANNIIHQMQYRGNWGGKSRARLIFKIPSLSIQEYGLIHFTLKNSNEQQIGDYGVQYSPLTTGTEA